jgi:outer membrane lipoprotein-sorting protein
MRYLSHLHLVLLLILATPCLAETPPSRSTIEPQAVFKRLQDFVGSSVLDFKTTVDARSGTLGTTRGSVHYVIKRPNLFRIEVSVGGNNYALVSDGQVMTL